MRAYYVRKGSIEMGKHDEGSLGLVFDRFGLTTSALIEAPRRRNSLSHEEVDPIEIVPSPEQ